MMARRIMAAFVLSAAAVILLAAPALAVPGTLKLSSLRARSVAAHGAVTALAAKPPPPPRHYQPPTTKPMPHTGPALPPGLATGAGAALVVVGGAGLLVLRRGRIHTLG